MINESVNGLDTAAFIEVSRKMISFDTTPQGHTVELCEYLKSVAEKLGFTVDIQTESSHGVLQSNILIHVSEQNVGDAHLLLQSHLDTVDPGSYPLWKKNDFNPFDAVIEDGYIYGLGSADVKLDFLCKLQALACFKNRTFKNLKPLLVGTFGEETGMQGALKLFRKNKINARYALVGEPTDLKIVNAAKGFATVEIRIPFSEQEVFLRKELNSSETLATESKVFSGKAAHSSTPHLGENAANKMLDYIAGLSDLKVLLDIDAGTRFNTIPHQAFTEVCEPSKDSSYKIENTVLSKIKKIYKVLLNLEQSMKQHEDSEFMPCHSTVSIGVVRCFEDHILIGGSCRIVPSVAQDIYEKWIQDIQDMCIDIGAEFHLQDYKKPYRTASKSIFLKATQGELEKMNLSSEKRTIASTNEASLFSRMGIECICFGPGEREGNIHTPNEKIRIDDLNKAIEFYKNMIQRLCL